jgi:hypothetical protein
MHKVLTAKDNRMIAAMDEDAAVKPSHDLCGIGRTATQVVVLCRRHQPHFAIVTMRIAGGRRATDVTVQAAGRDGTGDSAHA